MYTPIRWRPGYTLTELVITITIIGVLIWLGASSLRLDDLEKTREAALDVADHFRKARYLASRQNAAVVVVVRPFGAAAPGGGRTRGRIESYLLTDTSCPSGNWDPMTLGLSPSFPPADFGTFTSTENESEPGIARLEPADLASEHFCIRPNGRIINRQDNAPIRLPTTSETELAGKATIWVQYAPLRIRVADELAPPYMAVEVPYNGLVSIVQ